MIKKLSALALASSLALPLVALAGDLEDRVEELETVIEEQSEAWDMASRIQWYGDIRNRLDYHKAETPDHYTATQVAQLGVQFIQTDPTAFMGMMPMFSPGTQAELGGIMATMPSGFWPTNFQQVSGFLGALSPDAANEIAQAMGLRPIAGQDYENDTSYTTRLRLNMRVKATENVEVKTRFVAYKIWGMQSNPNGETQEYTGIHDISSPYFLNSRSFDGTVGRQPADSSILLDRAFMNWNNIAGLPMWFSIGRRPTTDGPPAHLRMGLDKRMATPVNYMDYPFDGISVGYAYALPGDMDGSGRIRFCYGRGYEAGSGIDTMDDVDFAGLSWDVMKSGDRFINIQSFGAFNIFNVPGDTAFPNPYNSTVDTDATTNPAFNPLAPTVDEILANSGMDDDGYLDRQNMGNIYHTALVYMDKLADVNFFGTVGWSHTDPDDGWDEMGISLESDSYKTPEEQDGYSVYVGARYDLEDLGLKLGLEYNWGSENWLAFTPGHDDMYSSKLQTRGSVYEAYLIYDLPGGEAISKFGKAFMRLGYQHYDYEYSYSGMWLGTPNEIDELGTNPLAAQFYTPVDSMDQVYLTMEAYF